MDALILAAGLGTRLRPITLTTPKPLVRVAGVPMVDRVAARLIAAGADRIVVNASHLAEQVQAHMTAAGWQTPDGAPVETAVSVEPDAPLETGGGIRHAAAFFRRDAPFLVHNGDILTTVDLAALANAQVASGAVATLAVAPARTDRYLLVDDGGLLGYASAGTERQAREPLGEVRQVDFCGVQACAPALLPLLEARPDSTFSIMTVYLALAREPGSIRLWEGAPTAPNTFLDVGTLERLAEAEAAVAAGRFA